MDTCSNTEYGSCTSIEMGEEPDMRLGDICLLCACRACERCGIDIDLDCENQIRDGNRGPEEYQGYWDVCDDCLSDGDVLYDPVLEAERRAEMTKTR
jgi:hypothetical protein